MALDRLLGTWQITMKHRAVTTPIIGQQRYERVLDDAYVLLDWTYEHPDFPDALALLSEVEMHYFDVRRVTRVFTLEWNADGWSTVHLDPTFSQRYTARFEEPGSIVTDGEYSDDGGMTWHHDFTMNSLRKDRP
ncbi:MAG: hypothetical protein JWP74_2084 [Marmoricola sp.]|nr:hypothetical protein [Marmoricola sp.]